MLLTAPPHWPGGVRLGEHVRMLQVRQLGPPPMKEETRSSQGAQMVP